VPNARAGREAAAWIAHGGELLPHLKYPSAQRKADVVKLWGMLKELIGVLNSPPAAGEGEAYDASAYTEAKNKWAFKFEKLARDYQRLLTKVASGSSVGKHIYVHLMAEHLPALMRIYGDLREFSGEGLEHFGKICSQQKLNFARATTKGGEKKVLKRAYVEQAVLGAAEQARHRAEHRPTQRARQLEANGLSIYTKKHHTYLLFTRVHRVAPIGLVVARTGRPRLPRALFTAAYFPELKAQPYVVTI
jgi:hypothetical protein